MFTNPTTITTVLAEQHRRDLLAQANAGRMARAARQGRPAASRRPRRRGVLRLAGLTAGGALIAVVGLRAGVPAATGFALAASLGNAGLSS